MMNNQTTEEALAEVVAGVALAAARRGGGDCVVIVEVHSAFIAVRSRNYTLDLDHMAAYVRPGDDEMGIAKRILAMRAAGLHVPRPVLDLVTPHGDAWEPPEPPPRKSKAELAAAVSPPKPAPEPAPFVPYHAPEPAQGRALHQSAFDFGD
jgi:hypothetical protein